MSCYIQWTSQIPNEAIRSLTSSTIPFDMDFSVVPELDIPKRIEGVNSDEMEYQQYLDSHSDDGMDTLIM